MSAPAASASPAAEAGVSAAEPAVILATPVPVQDPSAAEEIKQAVVSKSDAFGSVVQTLDSFALSLGSIRISLWDVMVVVVILIGVIAIAWLTNRFARSLLRRATTFDEGQRLLSEKLLSIFVWGLAFLVGIDVVGIDLTALAVFSGAFGLAIGFGLQKTFGNLIAGIILLMDRSIKPGDVIAVSDMSGRESFGQIRKIGIRAISVITRDRKEYLIPNENLMINQVENWSYSSREVRVKAPLGVAYGADLDLVEKLLYEAVDDTPRVLKYPEPAVRLMAFGGSSVEFEIRMWITDPEEGVNGVRSDVYKRVWRLFSEHKIEMPFPQIDVNFGNDEQFERLVSAIAHRIEGGRRSEKD